MPAHQPVRVTHHLVEIDPPNDRRDTWLVVCKQGDFTQSYLNLVTAYTESNKHINMAMVINELDRGIYRFDEGN